MYRRLSEIADTIATMLAVTGGCMLLGIVGLTCVSIAGRALVPLDIGVGPIRGIYDITEIAMAAAIFAFLPLAQLREAHARVDLFETLLPKRFESVLDVLFNIGMFTAAAFGTHRLYLGMLDKMAYGETTLIAQIPVWQGYAASLVGGTGFVVVAAFCVLRSLRRTLGITDDGSPS